MAATFVDVNKEKYLKALFRDVAKQTKMVDFANNEKNAKLIEAFVVGNPTNEIMNHGLTLRDGCIVIHRKKS